MITNRLAVFLLAVGVSLVSFAEDHDHDHEHESHHHHEHKHEHEEKHEHEHEHGQEMHVSAAARKLMGLTTVKAEKRRIRSTVGLWGRFELAGDARSATVSPMAGRIRVKVKPMQKVVCGDVLFSLSSPELRSRRSEIAIIEKRLAAYKGVGTRNAELESQLAIKRAELDAMTGGAKVVNDEIVVVSETAAMVDSLQVLDGSWVESGSTVVSLVRDDRLRFKARVAVADAVSLKDGMPIEIDGVVGILRVAIAEDESFVPVFAEFTKIDPSWRTGTRRRAVCVTDMTEEPVVAVPENCVISIGLDPVVFVKDDDEDDAFLPVKVQTGMRGGGYVSVDGLPEHAEIVKDGIYELKLALGGSTRKAGHFHADGKFHEGED